MKPMKIYYFKCNKIREFVNPKVSCISDKIVFLVFSIICNECNDNNDRIFKEENVLRY